MWGGYRGVPISSKPIANCPQLNVFQQARWSAALAIAYCLSSALPSRLASLRGSAEPCTKMATDMLSRDMENYWMGGLGQVMRWRTIGWRVINSHVQNLQDPRRDFAMRIGHASEHMSCFALLVLDVERASLLDEDILAAHEHSSK